MIQIHLQKRDNYIKKAGLYQLSQSIKKLINIQNLELILDQVKKPNTYKRKERKHKIGDQRWSLQSLIKDEERPLKAIFKKIQKFNRSKKELQKYVETLDPNEQQTLQKYVALRMKDGQVQEYDRVQKSDILKFLTEQMESNTRPHLITTRKFSSFEELFRSLNFITSLQKLKMNIRQNGIVNLDLKTLALCIDKLLSLQTLSLNLSMNVVSDIGIKHLFENIAIHKSLTELEYDLTSNLIKFEGAEYISKALISMSSRHKQKAQDQINNKEKQIAQTQLTLNNDDYNQQKEYPQLQKFSLNIRNNKIEFAGGNQLVEMACKLHDESVNVILLMGNCNIVDPNSDQTTHDYGYFNFLKNQLGQNFEFE